MSTFTLSYVWAYCKLFHVTKETLDLPPCFKAGGYVQLGFFLDVTQAYLQF